MLATREYEELYTVASEILKTCSKLSYMKDLSPGRWSTFKNYIITKIGVEKKIYFKFWRSVSCFTIML